MKLKVKFLKWSAGLPGVMVNTKTAKELGVDTFGRVSIKTISKYPRELSTFVDTIDKSVKTNEIVVSSETKSRLGLRRGAYVDVNIARPPRSVDYIRRKLDGRKLTRKQILAIIQDVVENNLSDPEVSLFVSAMYKQGMNFREQISLIKAILKTGNTLKFDGKYIVDKHSIGGVAGNRTTPIVVSICASAGLFVPKTSSRAITSAAGTADTIETIANVEFDMNKLKKILRKTHAFMVWGGALGMVPADSKIIKIEKSLKIDPESQLIASIMSKKLAVGSKYIVIDIPCGKSAKVSRQRAEILKQKFKRLAKHFRRKMEVVITDGSQPIGNGVGPALELMDVIAVLDPTKGGPPDLENKSVLLAAKILEMTKRAKKGRGEELAREILSSGKALDKFKEIIKAQGGKVKGDHFCCNLKKSKYSRTILSKSSGKVREIDNKKINSLARVAGAPADKYAGVYIHHHVSEKAEKNKPLITIYSESKPRLDEAVRFYNREKPIRIK